MLRTIGCVDRTLVATRPDVFIEPGQVLTLHADHVDMLNSLHPEAFVDLTPKPMFEGWGLEVPHRHALFYAGMCPDYRPADPGQPLRITTCASCNDTRRIVFA